MTKSKALLSARAVVRGGQSVDLYSRRHPGAPPHAPRAWTWRPTAERSSSGAALERAGYRLEYTLRASTSPAQRPLIL